MGWRAKQYLQLGRGMLSRKKELYFRVESKQLEGTLAEWCGLVAVTPDPPRTVCRTDTERHKISIKQYRIKKGHRHNKSQPLNFLTLNNIVDAPSTPKVNEKTGNIVNFTFSYGNSSSNHEKYRTQSIKLGQQMESISIAEQQSQNLFKFAFQQAKIQRHASACYISQHDEGSKIQNTQRIITTTQHQSCEGIDGLSRLESTSMLAHTDGEGDECWQGSTINKGANEESNKGLDNNRFFSRPQIRNFKRGDLFNAVKRSQTLKNDYQSESETSQILQDYKSLMSKIQENGIEEQFQQI